VCRSAGWRSADKYTVLSINNSIILLCDLRVLLGAAPLGGERSRTIHIKPRKPIMRTVPSVPVPRSSDTLERSGVPFPPHSPPCIEIPVYRLFANENPVHRVSMLKGSDLSMIGAVSGALLGAERSRSRRLTPKIHHVAPKPRSYVASAPLKGTLRVDALTTFKASIIIKGNVILSAGLVLFQDRSRSISLMYPRSIQKAMSIKRLRANSRRYFPEHSGLNMTAVVLG